MSNKNYNNFYNRNKHNEAQHSHDVPVVENPVEDVKPLESEIVENKETIVESTDPSTVETTPIPGINEISEETESTESTEENQNDSNIEDTTPENSSDESGDAKNVRVTIKALNIRKEASKDSDIVLIAHEGEELMLMSFETVNGFYSVVTSNGEQGYCMQEFVELV